MRITKHDRQQLLPPFGDRFPVVCRCFGSQAAGLRQRYQPTSSVVFSQSRTQRHGSYSFSVLRSHHWRSRQSSLATSVEKDRLQGRRADLSGAAWWHAPQYLQQFTRTADIPSRHRLRSSVTDSLFVPAVRLSTVDRRDFPVAGAGIWNDLLPLFTCKQRLKMPYFVTRSFLYHTSCFSPTQLFCGPCSSCLLL